MKRWAFEVKAVINCAKGFRLSKDLQSCELVDLLPTGCSYNCTNGGARDVECNFVTVECSSPGARDLAGKLPPTPANDGPTTRLRLLTTDPAAVQKFIREFSRSDVIVILDPSALVLETTPESSTSDSDGPKVFKIASIPAELCDAGVAEQLTARDKLAICAKGELCETTGCPPGSFANPDANLKDGAGGAPCQPCDKGGYYSPAEGKVGWHSHCACAKCGNGTYSKGVGATDRGKDCEVCPQGTQTSLEAGYRACRCLDGFSRLDRFGECLNCNELSGVECLNDFRTVMPGFHWTFASKHEMANYSFFVDNLVKSHDYDRDHHTAFTGNFPPAIKCPTPENCLGGINASCAEGTTGPLCAVCDKAYFNLNAGCYECPSKAFAVISTMLVAIVAAVLITLFVRANARTLDKNLKEAVKSAKKAAKIMRKKSEANLEEGEGVTAADDDEEEEKPPWYVVHTMTIYKILVQYVQIISVAATVYTGVEWPAAFRSSSGTLSIFSSNPASIAMPACVDDSWTLDAFASFRISVFTPLIGLVAIGIYYIVQRMRAEDEATCCRKHTCRAKGCVADKSAGDKYCGGRKCVKREVTLEVSKDNLCAYDSQHDGKCYRARMVTGIRLIQAKCISTAGLLFFLMYPTISVNCVQMLANCHEICTDVEGTDCTSHIRADYSSICYTGKHTTYMVFAALIFAGVSIITPAFLGYYINKNRNEFLDKDPTHTPSAIALGLGFFYRAYKEKKIHWEAVELFGKLAVTSVVVFIE